MLFNILQVFASNPQVDITVVITETIQSTITETFNTTSTSIFMETSFNTQTEVDTLIDNVTLTEISTEFVSEMITEYTTMTTESCFTITESVTITEISTVTITEIDVEVDTETLSITDTVSETTVISSVFTEVEVFTLTETLTISSEVIVTTCTYTNPNLPILIENMREFFVFQRVQLQDLEVIVPRDGVVPRSAPAYQVAMLANGVYGNPAVGPLLPFLYMQQVAQLDAIQNAMMAGLLRSGVSRNDLIGLRMQSQEEQMQLFLAYQQETLGGIIEFQNVQTSDPSWSTLPVENRILLITQVFPEQITSLSGWQQDPQMRTFVQFQESQAHLYP